MTTAELPNRRRYAARKSAKTIPGLGIMGCWINLFELNEKLPKKKKMVDSVIATEMLRNFPKERSLQGLLQPRTLEDGARNPLFRSVNQFRNLYNAGRMTCILPRRRPKIQSYRYNVHGDRVNPRTGRPFLKSHPKLPSGKRFK